MGRDSAGIRHASGRRATISPEDLAVIDILVLAVLLSLSAVVHLAITGWCAKSGTDLEPSFVPPRVF
jgi:hypothetical protein